MTRRRRVLGIGLEIAGSDPAARRSGGVLSANSTELLLPAADEDPRRRSRTPGCSPASARTRVPSLCAWLAGYALACVVGIALGMLLGWSRRCARRPSRSLEFLRAIPPPALVPVCILRHRHRQRDEGVRHRVRLPVADPAEHDRRRRAASTRRCTDTRRVYGIARCATGSSTCSCRPPRRRSSPACGIALSLALILMVISEMVAAHQRHRLLRRCSRQRSFAIPRDVGRASCCSASSATR